MATDLAAVEAAEPAAEVWTYAGQARGQKRPVVEVWWDQSGTALLYAPSRGEHYVAGCMYEVQVTRDPDGAGVTRHGRPKYLGQQTDAEIRHAAEAEAVAGGREVARDALERRAAKAGPLADVLELVGGVAGGMTHRQRDAFVALLQREVYTATRGGAR